MLNTCSSCGGNSFYLCYKGDMLGLYCRGCNKWVKWLGHKDTEYALKTYELRDCVDNAPSSKHTYASTTTATDVPITINSCNRCSSSSLFLTIRGKQLGLYCSDCDSWIKWVGKKEEAVYKQHYPLYTVVDKEVTTEPLCCKKCGTVEDLVACAKGNQVGLYCPICHSWIKWLSKSERALYGMY